MIKSIFLSLALLVASLTSSQAFAENSCSFAFTQNREANYSYNLETGKIYKFHLRDKNEVLIGTLKSTAVADEATVYKFNVEGQEYDFKAQEILGIRENEKKRTLSERLIEMPLQQFLVAKKISQLMFKPFKTLAPATKRLEVVGNWTASKETGVMLADELSHFDTHMEGFGFTIPALTRIVVSDRPILPELIGPFSLSSPHVNIWKGFTAKPSIAMSPLLYKTGAAKSRSVLFHERMHSLLHATFVMNSFVNSNHTLQEALADFGAALYTGTPEIGPEVDTQPIRNIHTRYAQFAGPRDARTTVLDAKATTGHENSMMISNIFWDLRNAIGAAETQTLLYPLIETLNVNRASFDKFLKAAKIESKEGVTQFAQDLDYILAASLKATERIADTDLRAKARASILKSVNKLSYSKERVLGIEAFLTPLPQAEFKPNKLKGLINGIMVTSYGVAGLAIDGAFTYWVGLIGNGLLN